MADNNVDDIYGTGDQVAFARKMAEALLQDKPQYSAELLKTPGSWMLNVPSVLKALSGAQYRDIAGSQDQAIRKRSTDENYVPKVDAYGRRIGQPDAKIDPSKGLGADPSYLGKLINIESNNDPRQITGSNRGLGQFGPKEEARYGINDNNWTDPDVQKKAIMTHTNNNRNIFIKTMGREPTQGELYLMHQQGEAGGPALLKNPDIPAWQAIRQYYPSDKIAKLAITGNIPDKHPLKNKDPNDVTAGEFAKLWISRFPNTPLGAEAPQADAAPTTPNAITPPVPAAASMPAKMGLGGSEAATTPMPAPPAAPMSAPAMQGEQKPTSGMMDGGLPKPDETQLAQNFTTQTATPGSDQVIKIPGYTGPAPEVPYLETKQQIQNRMMLGSQQDAEKVLKDYKDRAKPFEVPVPNGRLLVTPTPGGGGSYKFIAENKKETIDGVPIYSDLDEKGNTVFRLMIPGKTSQTYNNQADALKGLRDFKEGMAGINRDIGVDNKLAESKTSNVEDAIKHGISAGPVLQSLYEMRALSKASGRDMPSGPTSETIVKARQFLDNMGITTKGTPDAEVFQKLNSVLASESEQAFSSRGSNFKLQSFMRANPSLMNTKDGREMLIDILIQDQQQRKDIAKIAGRVKGKDVDSYATRVDEYYHNNPIILKMPLGDGKYQHVTTKNILSEDDISDLPKDMGFISPNGKVKGKP